MRRFLFLRALLGPCLLIGLGGLLSVCRAGINSNLFIESGKQFVLGGGQPGSFKVVAHNVGNVPVELRERPKGGGVFGRAILQPGQAATLRFLAGSAALVLNPSARTANLKLRITGDTRLGMGYEPNGQK
ncbi:hypothetical protein CDA63_05560 [Hymenobacter amundsenii]|uniref:DUF1573 domain-containing protein n=1 Tax=Hymenobacter amundsenii TaxID=2006685 RepID=A0A246FN87_9BACT|nr:hypothetical protein [Hymenobacter amundsenii]OWP64190.1 hypothetical protein CDA63_05560 [Hymenobacter amundsenii]